MQAQVKAIRKNAVLGCNRCNCTSNSNRLRVPNLSHCCCSTESPDRKAACVCQRCCQDPRRNFICCCFLRHWIYWMSTTCCWHPSILSFLVSAAHFEVLRRWCHPAPSRLQKHPKPIRSVSFLLFPKFQWMVFNALMPNIEWSSSSSKGYQGSISACDAATAV